jgi:predicted nucleic acid-binding protein
LLPKHILLDADVFISYLIQDDLFEHSVEVVEYIITGKIVAYVSSEIYDDIVSMLRSNGVSLDKVVEFINAVSKIPHKPLPLNPEIAAQALKYYMEHGGSRKLHYFDSYHVATAKYYSLPLLTSDKYIIDHSNELGIQVINIRTIK